MHINYQQAALLLAMGIASVSKQACAQSVAPHSQSTPSQVNIQAPDSTKPAGKPIRIVCVSSSHASDGPIFMVDGKPASLQDISSINPNDIESMNILKEFAATAIYGSRGANGVVLITLKHSPKKYMYRPEKEIGHLN